MRLTTVMALALTVIATLLGRGRGASSWAVPTAGGWCTSGDGVIIGCGVTIGAFMLCIYSCEECHDV
jgi:hypothetical protein